MVIDGKKIAQVILQNLSEKVQKLKEKGTTPNLFIILAESGPASTAYVRQKELKATEIGAKTTVLRKSETISQDELIKLIDELNKDPNVHGIIAQRPLPAHIEHETIALAVDPKKDVDGLHPASNFPMPLAEAVLKILESIGETKERLSSKKVVVIGKGKTGGAPIIAMLRDKLGVSPLTIDSRTQNPSLITKEADVIISAVGKPNILNSQMIKKGSILISVGLHKGSDGKLHGDYEEEEIKNTAAYYTPTPGGVGPVNVAMLLQNLVTAAQKTI